MKQYLDAIKKIKENGVEKETRNGVTKSVFVYQMRFDLSKGFPATTTKKLAFKAVLSELL
jgi:thymidylate synthase